MAEPTSDTIVQGPHAGLVAVLLAWLTPALAFIAGVPGFVGADPYFHVQISHVMAAGGLAWPTFRWATESVWAEAWFDKDWLFHLLLAPFVRWHRILGAKVFCLLAVLFVAACLWSACRALGLSRRQSGFWTCLLPWTCFGLFWFRLSVCRPHVLSIGLVALILGFTFRRRPAALAATAFVYTLAHASHWQLLGLVLLYDILRAVLQEDGRRRLRPAFTVPLFVYAFAGVAAATIIHPSFPRNLHGLFIQNVLVLFSAGAGTGATERIGELQPTGWRLLWLLAPIFIAAVAGIAAYLRIRLRPNRQVVFLGVCALGYLLLAAFALRFLDYAVPMAVLWLAASWSQLQPQLPGSWRLKRLAFVFAVGVLIFGALGFRRLYGRYCGQAQVTHVDAGVWLRRNLAPNEIVFVTRFHDNAVLWFHAPDLRFMTFLDPIFMQQRSPERYTLWEQIRRGQHPDPVAAITGVFRSRAVFVIADPRVPDPEQNAELKLVQQLEAAGATCFSRNNETGARVYLLSQHPLRPGPVQ